MVMQIKLKTCFSAENLSKETVFLPKKVKTVAELLGYMGRMMNSNLIDQESGEIEFDLEILLNHKEIWFHPMGLNTLLRQGDIVEIYPLPLGGG
jgi:hypothetical protein